MNLKERKKAILKEIEWLTRDTGYIGDYAKSRVWELTEELKCVTGEKWWWKYHCGHYYVYVDVMPKDVKAEDMPWVKEKRDVDHLFIVTNKGTFKVHGYQKEFWVDFIQDINGG